MPHESKFDKQFPMGSVPNCRKEIGNRYGVKWFKCEFKQPKNSNGKSLKLSFTNFLFAICSLLRCEIPKILKKDLRKLSWEICWVLHNYC